MFVFFLHERQGKARQADCLSCVRRSFLDETWFLEQEDPLEWGHRSSPEELKLALLVFEEMQLCLRVGLAFLSFFSHLFFLKGVLFPSLHTDSKTFRVLERNEACEKAHVFFPQLCAKGKGKSPLQAVLDKVSKRSSMTHVSGESFFPVLFPCIFPACSPCLCTGCRILATSTEPPESAPRGLAGPSEEQQQQRWLAIPPNLFYRLVLACKKRYCSGEGAIFHRFHVWENAGLLSPSSCLHLVLARERENTKMQPW